MKRKYRIQFLCLLVLAALAACGGQATGVQTTAAPAQTPTSEPTATTPAGRGGSTGEEGEAPPDTLTTGSVEEVAADPAGRGVLYEIPFDVREDGFGFRNYGAGHPEGAFTIDELRQVFGDSVCSRVDIDGEKCIPTAEAQQWIADRNADMLSGHCIGFTVTSYYFNADALEPEEFSRTADVPYELRQTIPVMRTIALNGSLYWVESVWSREVTGSPRDIIDALLELRELVDLSIYLPGLAGGHSLLAYGVEEVAPGQFRILTYDSNYPGIGTAVEVDYEANTWRYAQGAVNPDQVAVPYEGDATTETLRFLPLSAYETATCPFCPADDGSDDADSSGQRNTMVSVYGDGEVLITSVLGRIGQVAGEIIDDLPGATLLFPRGQLAGAGSPDIVLPDTSDFKVEFSGLERVSSQGPGLSVAVDKLTRSSETSQLSIAPETQTAAFEAGSDQSPVVAVSVLQDERSYTVSLVGLDFEEGQELSIGVAATAGGANPTEGGLEISTADLDISDATLLLTRRTPEGEAVFATTDLTVPAGGSVTLDVNEWDGEGSIDQYVDDDGDGTYEEQPDELENEPIEDVLEESDPEDAAAILDNVAPVLPDQGLDAILATVAGKGLTGEEIGAVLQRLNLPDETLVAIITALALPVDDLAGLFASLRLEPERLEAVIAALELSPEDEDALRALIDEHVLYLEIVSEWRFLNTDDVALLAALLNERGLTAAQVAVVLPRLGLDDAAIEAVLGGLALPLSDLEALAAEFGVNVPEPTPTPSPTPADAAALDLALTETPTVTVTATLTGTATPDVTPTEAAVETPTASATPEPYPGGPLPTGTPNPYPYPGDLPTETPTPGGYPEPEATATPDYLSVAFCDGDVLRIIAQEPAWIDVELEVWSSDDLLFTGLLGPEGEPLEIALAGPGSWPDVYILSPSEPTRVPFGDLTCPAPEPSPTPGE
jgi:hypothetical protein